MNRFFFPIAAQESDIRGLLERSLLHHTQRNIKPHCGKLNQNLKGHWFTDSVLLLKACRVNVKRVEAASAEGIGQITPRHQLTATSCSRCSLRKAWTGRRVPRCSAPTRNPLIDEVTTPSVATVQCYGGNSQYRKGSHCSANSDSDVGHFEAQVETLGSLLWSHGCS